MKDDDGAISINMVNISTAAASYPSESSMKLTKRLSRAITKDGASEQLLQKQPKGRRCRDGFVRCCRIVVESTMVTALTTILTIYTLIGDDVKSITTQHPADEYFNFVTLFCMLVFSIEIVLSCFGKDDYFLGFFFFLDIISTVTMFTDLTWVQEKLAGNSEDANSVRSSRTARIGAKTGRVVRVLRLVRILKLYKAIYEARQRRKKLEQMRRDGTLSGDGDEDWDELDVDMNEDQLQNESMVGKKLSELTTRRVIILVLVMMMVLPLLRVDQVDQTPQSAYFGADTVHTAFLEMLANNTAETRAAYESAILELIYYHNWYTGHLQKCPMDTAETSCQVSFQSQLFWIGIVSNDANVLTQKVRMAQISPSSIRAYEDRLNNVTASGKPWMFNPGSMPTRIQQTLALPWSTDCEGEGVMRRGVSLIAEIFDDGLNKVKYAARCPEDFRANERITITPRLNIKTAEFDNWRFAFYIDQREFARSEAQFSLGTTFFVCFALLTASLMFTNDANRLVLYPVENMISKVETIRKNPLLAMKVADDEFKREEYKRAQEKLTDGRHSRLRMLCEMVTCSKSGGNAELMETVILEKTIIKLGSLLALGFGEAGANIIEHNMSGVDTACVDAMVEGTRVECIIGIIRIRDFGTATEVLQAKVLTFVNQIAEIVHGVVDEFHGAANKNTGDTFLMVWRIPTISEERNKSSKIADMSMLAFTRILAAVHRSPVLAQYRGHPGLQQRLGRNCRVNITSALHYGWAIEGAVGSEFKIDASYLSPNVSIAESLEKATKIYGVSLLIAESVIAMCSPAMASKCRLIDRVIIRGSVAPMELFAIDLDYMFLSVEPALGPQKWTSRERFKVRQFLESEKESKWGDEVEIINFFNENTDIASMRFRYTLEFIHVFKMGFQNYTEGEWEVAERMLRRTREMLGVEDGPSAALLRFMEKDYNFHAPEGWHGVRELIP